MFYILYFIPYILYFFPQGLWIVKNFSVENRQLKIFLTGAVNKLLFFTIWLWIKSQRHSRAFATFPHKLLLLRLLLQKPIYGYISLSLLDKKEVCYAIYL